MKKQQDNFLHVSFFILFFLFFLEVEISTTDCACTSSTVIPFGLFELVLGCRHVILCDAKLGILSIFEF